MCDWARLCGFRVVIDTACHAECRRKEEKKIQMERILVGIEGSQRVKVMQVDVSAQRGDLTMQCLGSAPLQCNELN